MQVVPGPEGTVAAVVAGDPLAVAEHTQQLCEQLWSFSVPRRGSRDCKHNRRTIGTNLGKYRPGLAAIEPLVEEEGAVAICSDLDAGPGHSIGQLINNPDIDRVALAVRNDHSPDSWPAWQLARAMQRGPVYFLSQLESDDVEDMGLAPVENLEELERLAVGRESCIVVDDSQYAVVTVESGS